VRTILLLIASNLFMTIAWYGHLRFKHVPIWQVILVSWGIAFFEYCLQVPANRWGHGQFTAAQLKIFQEVITLVVFIAFAWAYLGERLRWNELVAFVLVFAAVVFATLPVPRPAPISSPTTAQFSDTLPGDGSRGDTQ
jgi:uncharacterized protein (DUF486 family)